MSLDLILGGALGAALARSVSRGAACGLSASEDDIIMTLEGWTLILGFVALVAAIARPLGLYLDAVFAGRGEHCFRRFCGPSRAVSIAWRALRRTQNRTGKPTPLAIVVFSLAMHARALRAATLARRACRSIRRTSTASRPISR